MLDVGIALTLALVGDAAVRAACGPGSAAIEADAMHYKTDLAINLGVAAAIAASRRCRAGRLADPLVAAAVIVVPAVRGLEDRQARAGHPHGPRNSRCRDREADRAPGRKPSRRCIDIHDLKTRHGGANYIVQFHVMLDANLSLARRPRNPRRQSNTASRPKFPDCELLLHPDPQGYRPNPAANSRKPNRQRNRSAVA